jgi:hypothetical protein
MTCERRLDARLRRLSEVEGSSASVGKEVGEGVPFERGEGGFGGEVMEEELGLLSSAK